MAHEQLKFKLHIDDNQEWQPIFGDQQLNTFYMVYILFEEVSEGLEEELGLPMYKYKCKFRIQNFRGAVTFGFCGVPNLTQPNDSDEIGTEISLDLCAFKHEEYKEVVYKLDKPIDRNKLLKVDSNIFIRKEFVDENDPINSDFLDPFKFRRDGNVAVELGQRKYNSGEAFKAIPGLKLIGTPKLGICAPSTSILI